MVVTVAIGVSLPTEPVWNRKEDLGKLASAISGLTEPSTSTVIALSIAKFS